MKEVELSNKNVETAKTQSLSGEQPKPPRSTWKSLQSILMLLSYDIVITFFQLIIHTFFRDIKTRGSFNIPAKGPLVFVIAPHHNQFVDGLVVMSQVREHLGRRIAFLIANKSYNRNLIGHAAKLCSAIPVERSQDLLKTGKGKIFVVPDSDGFSIRGEGTQFTQDCMVKGLIGLPNSLSNSPIEEIIDDTHLKLKKPFKSSNPQNEPKIEKVLREGCAFKTAPHIDNHIVFDNVFKHLNDGKVLGIFPEGGSHDRPDLLPLKPGVAIMALGAIASKLNEGVSPEDITPVNIIPVGLNYFHPHKFRSRVVIDFGKPIVVDPTMARAYNENSRDAVGVLLQKITLGLKEVTVTCNDYDTLMVVQAARRLYTSSDRESIPLALVVEMNRRLVKGYQRYANEPDVIELRNLVMEYNRKLMRVGIHDHQVELLSEGDRVKIFMKFVERLFKFGLFMGLSLPGIFLFSPVFITARRISRKKAKEALAGSSVKIKAKDVLSTWKILVALVLAPALYIFYSIIGTILIVKLNLVSSDWMTLTATFLFCYGWAVLTTYASLRVGEIGVDYYKSLKPLFICILSHHSQQIQIQELKLTRRALSEKVTEFCNRYGPNMFEDYNRFYRKYNSMEEEYDLQGEREETPEATVEISDESEDAFNLNNLADIPIFSNIFDRGVTSGGTLEKEEELGEEEKEELIKPPSDVNLRVRAAMRIRRENEE